MKLCRQGHGHYLDGLNNQDFYFSEGNLAIVMDGCSSGNFSEVGTRLFAQQFALLPNKLSIDHFEQNVKTAFDNICLSFPTAEQEYEKAVSNNMLFTILARFELEDEFVVKYIGDGYIIAINKLDNISYIRLSYGKAPPYFAYNRLTTQTYAKELSFKTLRFPKEDFKNVGIATDGLAPLIEKKAIELLEPIILGHESIYTPEGIVRSNSSVLYDDITVLV